MAVFSTRSETHDGRLLEPWLRLRSLLEELQAIILKHPQSFSASMKVFSLRDTKPVFLTFAPELQQKTVDAFSFFVECVRVSIDKLETPKNSKVFLWRSFQHLGLLPPDDLFDQFGDEELVEVYSSDNIQTFRSFSILDYVSYSIEDLIVYPWHSLFSYEEAVTSSLIQQATKLFKGELNGIHPNVNQGSYIVRELQSEEGRCLELQFGIVAPLKTKAPSDIRYFISTIKSLKRVEN